MGSSLVLFCNIRSFVIKLDYDYRYLLEVCYELSDICFLIWLGMKAIGNGRENTLTIFVFIFLFGNGNGNGKTWSGKRNRLCGISETVQFDRSHVDNGREPVLKSGNNESCNTFKCSTPHNGYNHI